MATQKTPHARMPDTGRRAFLQTASGLTFAVVLGGNGLALIAPAQAKSARDISAWVRISPNNQITIVSPAAEMGQGSMTGVPMALAEELDADWSKVTLEMAPAEPAIYGYNTVRRGRSGKLMGIFGSRAVMKYFDQMRIAGAQVRKVLLANAAQKWAVPVTELTTEPSVVVHQKSGQRMTYGEIAAFATVPSPLPSVAPAELKKKSDFRIIGSSVPRHDIPEKVNGTAQYSIDVQLPGMVYASTVHSPVQQGHPKSWNNAAVRAIPGVIDVVRLDTGIAVVAGSMEHVLEARDALEITWDGIRPAEGYSSETALEKDYPAIIEDPSAGAKILEKKGYDGAVFATAAKTFQQTYRSDYGYHAQMEPLNAVARFNDDGTLEVWEGTQAPGISRNYIARAMGLDREQVIHHQHYLGGGFGRRSISDYTVEAAHIARQVKRPVKMIWTREEDIAHGMFRPQVLIRMEAALDPRGTVVGWRQCSVGDGGRLLHSGIKIPYYRVPNQHIERRGTSHNIRLKHWRAVAHPFNVFAHEAFIDEIAAASGTDPLEFRRRHLAMTPKAKRVFDRVATMCDWSAKRPDGRAIGLSISERSGSLGAGVVEVSLDAASNKIRVHKVWIAVDAGIVVQPDAARRNVESGVIYGLSSVLKERATIVNGAVAQSNFHDYEVLRMSEAPEEIHVDFLDRDTKPTGIGEIGNPFIGAAVANAFHKLTGKRLYHMPFTPDRVEAALKA